MLPLVLAMTSSLAAGQADAQALRNAVSLYASFDKEVKADRGEGQRTPDSRTGKPQDPSSFRFKNGYPADIYRIVPNGLVGGCLEARDILPDSGRIFFPAKGNIAFKKGGWGGAVSVWINTDPNRLLKTSFCDPFQLTQKGANNGGIWIDFTETKPLRTIRMGIFPAVPEGQKGMGEDDPKAPLVAVPGIDWKVGQWHHLVVSWNNFDTGRADAVAQLYLDGQLKGEIKDRPLAMDWDLEKAGLYFAVNYIGLLDEFTIFSRALSAGEVTLLHQVPGVLRKE